MSTVKLKQMIAAMLSEVVEGVEDHGERLDEHDAMLEAFASKLIRHDKEIGAVNERVDSVDARVKTIEPLVDRRGRRPAKSRRSP